MEDSLLFINYNLLRNELRRDEGVKNFPYYDTVGKLTIGAGRNLDDVGLSDEEVDFLLDSDISRVVKELAQFEWFPLLSPDRKRAIINMCFNLGITRFKKFKKMIKALEAGDYRKASKEALNSKWALQVGNRAKRIAVQIREG